MNFDNTSTISFAKLKWHPWRVDFQVDDKRVSTLPRPRPGFRYGHYGHGRDAIFATHIGDENWTDYTVDLDFMMLPVSPQFTPFYIPPGTARGFYLLFRVQDLKESWNEAGKSCYQLSFNENGNWGLSRSNNQFCNRPSGYGNLPPHSGYNLINGKTSHILLNKTNHLRLTVQAQHIKAWLNDHLIVDYTDNNDDGGNTAHTFGGIAFSWRYESMGWVENFKIKHLATSKNKVSIEQALQQYPKVTLTRSSPTPFNFLPHLSRHLDINLYIKRDDLTDLALGGDKPRKLEYEIAQAQAKGADILVTCGSSQSNMARLTVAAAKKVGMECALVLSRDEWQAFQGNLLMVYLMGAKVNFVSTTNHWALEDHALELCETLKSEGYTPYYIPVSGTTPHSCLGYVQGALELIKQISIANIQPDAIYTPFGTGGIFTAILFTLRQKGIQCPVIGISVNANKEDCQKHLDTWWTALCDLLNRDPLSPRGSYEIYDDFIGIGYGDPAEASLDAVMQMAQTEGILLDPVYSGKMFSGFLAHHQAGRWQTEQHIVLIHSGGVPALFAYHAEIEAHLRKRRGII